MGPQRHLPPPPTTGRDCRRCISINVPTGRRVDLGAFHSPPRYAGEWRCDAHPRFSRDGNTVCIDSPHGGDGRQLYELDVSGIS